MSVGVIIGRFQIHEIHNGHVRLIEAVRKRHEQVLVLLGCNAMGPSQRYPLDFAVRQQMIRDIASDVLVCPVFDHKSDQEWSRQVDGMLFSLYPGREITLYGGRDSFVKAYHGHYKTEVLDFADDTSATEIRRKIAAAPIPSTEFRAGMIYAAQNLLPRVIPTVDIAMVKPDWSEVLLGRKPGEKGFRFPGGHVDLSDSCLEQAANRELFEETGMITEGGLHYVCSVAVDDWRHRGNNDTQILTALFWAQYSHGKPEASDDLSAVEWRPLSTDNVVAEHVPLMAALVNHREDTHESDSAD